MELNITGSDKGTVAVSDDTFSRDFNEALVHQVVTAYLAGARQGTRAQKTRSEVRGGAIKDAGQSVVIRRGDRIELVIVAACTGNRQAEHALGHGVDLLVNHVELELGAIAVGVTLGADRQVTGSDLIPRFFGSIGYFCQVPGQLQL